MARPLSKKGPQARIPATPLSDSADHYRHEQHVHRSRGGGPATPSRPSIANSVSRSGRGMKASQPKQMKSKGNINKAALS